MICIQLFAVYLTTVGVRSGGYFFFEHDVIQWRVAIALSLIGRHWDRNCGLLGLTDVSNLRWDRSAGSDQYVSRYIIRPTSLGGAVLFFRSPFYIFETVASYWKSLLVTFTAADCNLCGTWVMTTFMSKSSAACSHFSEPDSQTN